MIKIGHRGAKGHLAENTIASIQKAIELKVHGIEIDVHKCLSGEIVVHHDFTLDRTTNGTGEISSVSFSVLKNLKVEDEYSLPTLQNVLDIIPDDFLVNIELKGRHTAKKVAEILQENFDALRLKPEQIIVSSFQREELKTIHQENNTLQLGVLTQASVTEALSFAKEIKAYSIHPNYTLLSPAIVAKAKNEGFKVITWTVNEKRDILRMKDYKVDGIISDFPERL